MRSRTRPDLCSAITSNAMSRFELKGDFDLVTEADRASEKLIVERLKARFPDHGILAEEGSGHESPSEYRWYVDPLDGTTNFAHGYPVYNVTLALEKAGELIAGVIFDPNRDELFTCEKGGGAFLNGRANPCFAGGETGRVPLQHGLSRAGAGISTSISTSITSWRWRAMGCGAAARRRSIWLMSPAGGWTDSGSSG